MQPIVDSVRDDGDKAVAEWTAKFDKVELESVCVPIDVSPLSWVPYEALYNT